MDIVQKQEHLETWYLALNPKAVIPTLTYGDSAEQVVTDSTRILRFIGELAEGNSLIPPDGESQTVMNTLIDLADLIWTFVLPRLELLGYTKWLDGRMYPRVSEYYQRVKQRESFALAQVQNAWWEN